MSRFAQDRQVIYVEPPMYLKKLRKQFVDRKGSRQDLFRAETRRLQSDLYVFRTGAFCPIAGRRRISTLTWENWRLAFRRCLTQLGIEDYILWISRPSWLPALEYLQNRLLIYHVVDEYSAYSTVTDRIRARILDAEASILDQADLVIVVSEALLASKGNMNANTFLVANGVDVDAYQTAPASEDQSELMMGLHRPIIGYSGLIARRLDLGLLLDLANKRPDYSLVLLGAVNDRGCESEMRALRACRNVHFLGVVAAAEVPACISAFDVCIIPYQQNERAANADPLKLYEYAAAGKETVCTDFAAARKAAGPFCHVEASSDGFLSRIDQVLRHSTRTRVAEQARAWASDNSWDQRVRQISELISERLVHRTDRPAASP